MKPPKKDYLKDNPDELFQEYLSVLHTLQEAVSQQLKIIDLGLKEETHSCVKMIFVDCGAKILNEKLFDAMADLMAIASRARDVGK
ncbi:hypothetical protein NIES2100_35250 [Calothrix sp. NIES-2100]|uniref:hypothetical protein n=1 Tax=Calothrix sp. NIES-2100 TaxID=1954172 RepID=UPI000B61C80F|nr:hypothetical protein NIES2100_35250 [Calothrix sp. NIES-2100]